MELNVINSPVLHKVIPVDKGSSNLFYTLSFLVFDDFNHFNFIRQYVAQHVSDNWRTFRKYTVDPITGRSYCLSEMYLSDMEDPATPGRGCELLVASKLFNARFELYVDENLCFHCGMSDAKRVGRIKVSPLNGGVHFDAYSPCTDDEMIKEFGGPRTICNQNSDSEHMRKEFMKSVTEDLLKIIFPDFMLEVDNEVVKTVPLELDNQVVNKPEFLEVDNQVVKPEPEIFHHGFETVLLTESSVVVHAEEKPRVVDPRKRRGGRPKKKRVGRVPMCLKYGNIYIKDRRERSRWNKEWRAANPSAQTE